MHDLPWVFVYALVQSALRIFFGRKPVGALLAAIIAFTPRIVTANISAAPLPPQSTGQDQGGLTGTGQVVHQWLPIDRNKPTFEIQGKRHAHQRTN